MTWDYIMIFGGYAAVIWWAYTADFSAESDFDCEQDI
jgi:hypothetical protein